MSNYLTQVVTLDDNGQSITLKIRDEEIWEHIGPGGGEIKIINGLLPTANADSYASYGGCLVLCNQSDVGTNNTYDEYIIVREGAGTVADPYTYFWEKIGTTDLNMSGYSLKGHTHQVTTNVSVEDHDYTPKGTVTVTLKDPSNVTNTQPVSGTITSAGTITLSKDSATPTSTISITEPTNGGTHDHIIDGSVYFVKEANEGTILSDISVDTGTSSDNDITVPTINTSSTASAYLGYTASAVINGYRETGGSSNVSSVLSRAEATNLTNHGDGDNYSLSFVSATPSITYVIPGENLNSSSHVGSSTISWNTPALSTGSVGYEYKKITKTPTTDRILKYNERMLPAGITAIYDQNNSQYQYFNTNSGDTGRLAIYQGFSNSYKIRVQIFLSTLGGEKSPIMVEDDSNSNNDVLIPITTTNDLTEVNYLFYIENSNKIVKYAVGSGEYQQLAETVTGNKICFDKANSNLCKISNIYIYKVDSNNIETLLKSYIPGVRSDGVVGLCRSYFIVSSDDNPFIASSAYTMQENATPTSTSSYGTPLVKSTGETNSSNISATVTNISATFTGSSATHSLTTKKTEVQSTMFTGYSSTNTDQNAYPGGNPFVHTVNNPTVYSGPDSYDDPYTFNEWYGITYDENEANSEKTRIGNYLLHQELPVQSGMRRCLLLDDGTVNYYLHPYDSTKKLDGTGANLDGTDGQVMVEVPRHWRQVTAETSGSSRIITAKISKYRQDGWIEVPTYYVSAYEACFDSNGKLRSVSGQFPKTSETTKNFRDAARARGANNTIDTRWNILTYQIYIDLYWLYVIEYANTNSQADYNPERTVNGYMQGGLGSGMTNITGNYPGTSTAKWIWFNNYSPIIKTGTTDENGNFSIGKTLVYGGSSDTRFNTGQSGRTFDQLFSSGDTPETYVACYRGIENIFGHVWKACDGVKFNTSHVYRCNVPANFNTDNMYDVGTTYFDVGTKGGTSASGSYPSGTFPVIKNLMITSSSAQIPSDGSIIPSSTTGGTNDLTSYYCDSYWMNESSSGRALFLGGSADCGAAAGLGFVNSAPELSRSSPTIGSRLCFCPQNW